MARLDVGAPGHVRSYPVRTALDKHAHALARLSWIATRFDAILDVAEEVHGPGTMYVEGYAFGAKTNREVLGEWGGQVRLRAWERGWTVITVPPTVLKKFVLGRGVGEKSLVLQQVLKKWAFEAADDNEGDAYALMRFGLLHQCQKHLELPKSTLELFKGVEAYPARAR
jgi:Holliday junction resolvasome RuvABC endonuclease subunit